MKRKTNMQNNEQYKENKALLFVANWKSYFTPHQECSWYTNFGSELHALAQSLSVQIVFCPSYLSLPFFAQHTEKNRLDALVLGGQDCNIHAQGPYTGTITAAALYEVGCVYVIVGHSETRVLQKLTHEQVAAKVEQALRNDLIPIVCVGEQVHEVTRRKEALDTQLAPILACIKKYPGKHILIAYEPVWAIGTGKTPTPQEIADVLSFIAERLEGVRYTLLYGGSVNATNAPLFAQSIHCNGFLIGKASTDFQELKKIVRSVQI